MVVEKISKKQQAFRKKCRVPLITWAKKHSAK